jgi:energy-coupling factor transport system permease protein
MLVTWKYRPRDTFIQRLDPRARLIVLVCLIIAITQFWDLRFLLPLFGVSLGLYLMARIEWRDARRAWYFIVAFVLFIVGLNALLSGRGGPTSVLRDTSPVLWQSAALVVPGVDWRIAVTLTVGKTAFAMTQVVRMLAMAVLAIPIPYTLDPAVYGTTFRRLGLPDKASYSIDLAFRLIPTLGRDFALTLDAQRARGYEVERLRGGLFDRLRRLAPLLVPVLIHAILSGEEIVDAMELRAFGAQRRTWTRDMRFQTRDYLFLAFGLAVAVGSVVLSLTGGYAELWIPPFLYRLRGG